MTMLAAGNDRALGISRRFWGGVPRAGRAVEGVLEAGIEAMHEYERMVLVAAGWIEPFTHEPQECLFRQGAHLLQREVALGIPRPCCRARSA